MKNKNRIKKVVLEILEKHPETRADDFLLIVKVFDRLNVGLNQIPIGTVFSCHRKFDMPNINSIMRYRRAIQAEREDLVSETARKARKDEEVEYVKEFSKK